MAYVNRLREELNYNEFNHTHLMPSLNVEVLLFLPIPSIPTLFFCILVQGDVSLKYLYQDAPTPSVPNDPLHLPWIVYVYGPGNFARKCPMPRNTNVTGYPFLDGTRVMSSLPLLSLFLILLHLSIAHYNPFSFQISAHYPGA